MEKFISKVVEFGVILAVIIAIAFAGALMLKMSEPKTPEITYWKEYLVQPGDTLWDIIDNNNDYDMQEIIKVVKEKNGLKNSSDLRAYDVVELPVWENN